MSHIRPIDVCLIVRDLFGCIQECGITPNPPVELPKCLVPAVAQRVTGEKYRIELSPRSWDSRHLFGMLLRYDTHAKIIYSQSMNTCWRRFVVCKELAHLLIDTDAEHFTNNPVSLVQELINDVPVMRTDHDINSERLAMIAAVEMLLPWCLRGQLTGMAEEGLSDLQIAQEFRVPEKIVNLMLRSDYGNFSKESNGFSTPKKD